MKRFGMLKPDAYPALRWSLFCGEALPVEVAEAWARAAPSSTVENLYGPTELTIACTLYRWDPERSPVGMRARARADRRAVSRDGSDRRRRASYAKSPPGDDGGAASDRPAGHARLLARSGEDAGPLRRAARPRADLLSNRRSGSPGRGASPIAYLGRVDHQIKIKGYRVELGEIEAALREATGIDAVIAVGWPRTDAGASGVTRSSEARSTISTTSAGESASHFRTTWCRGASTPFRHFR